MQDFVGSMMLVCAAIASLALGVILAFWVCRVGFAALRLHAESLTTEPVAVKPQVARVS